MELITETLEDEIDDNNARDAILIAVEGHGVMAPDKPDFVTVAAAINQFAQKILERVY